MPEKCTEQWDPAAPTYQLAVRDDCTQVDSVSAIEALRRQGVPTADAAAAIKKAIDEGSALVQIIGADWRYMFSELDAAGIRVSAWMTY